MSPVRFNDWLDASIIPSICQNKGTQRRCLMAAWIGLQRRHLEKKYGEVSLQVREPLLPWISLDRACYGNNGEQRSR